MNALRVLDFQGRRMEQNVFAMFPSLGGPRMLVSRKAPHYALLERV